MIVFSFFQLICFEVKVEMVYVDDIRQGYILGNWPSLSDTFIWKQIMVHRPPLLDIQMLMHCTSYILSNAVKTAIQ